jgi:hypothetical protein
MLSGLGLPEAGKHQREIIRGYIPLSLALQHFLKFALGLCFVAGNCLETGETGGQTGRFLILSNLDGAPSTYRSR